MNLLELWDLSLALAGISLVIMLVLIVARRLSELRSKTRKARRDRLLPMLIRGELDDEELGSRGKIDDETTDLLVELIELVRGDERQMFVSRAERAGASDRLISRLQKGNSRAKITAAEALAYFPDDRATDALDRALDDKNRDVRLTAALSLSRSGRAPPISLLVERLSLGLNENSLLLTSILQRIVDDRPTEVEGLLEDDTTPPTVVACAVDALAAAGRFHTAPSINQLALQPDVSADELARYLRALGTFRHPAGIPAVTRHLDAPTWWVRAAAAEAAGKIGVIQVLPQLSALLDDEDWWVRFRASEALSQMGPDGVQSLRDAGQKGTGRARDAARLTLAELGVPSGA